MHDGGDKAGFFEYLCKTALELSGLCMIDGRCPILISLLGFEARTVFVSVILVLCGCTVLMSTCTRQGPWPLPSSNSDTCTAHDHI